MGLRLSNDDWLLLSILFFVVTVLLTIYYARTLKKATIFDPISIFIFFYCLFVLPLPVRAFFTKAIAGDVTDHLPELLPYLPWAVLLSGIGLPFFVWGYYSKSSWQMAQRIPQPKPGTHYRASFLVLTVISLALLSLLARDSGGLVNFILLGYNSTAEMFGKGYLAVGFPWLFIACLFLLYGYARNRRKFDLILFFAAALVVSLVQVVLGARGVLLYMGLAVVIFWHVSVETISARFLAVAALSAFLILNIMGLWRSSKYASFSDVWTRTESAESVGSSSGLFYTLTTGEFVVPFETLPQMIRSVGSEINPRFGLTYLEAPLFLIPSVLFPQRPATLTAWYMDHYYGGGFGANEGRAFFFTAEGYLNFGPLGVLATMLVWGWLLGALHQYRDFSKGQPGSLLLYALSVAFIFRGIAGDAASVVAGLPEQSLSVAVFGLWIASWGNPRHRFWRNARQIANANRASQPHTESA